MCYIEFSVVCLVFSVVFCLMSQKNEEAAECGAGSAALHSAGGSSDRPEHCLLCKFQKLRHQFNKQQFIFAL